MRLIDADALIETIENVCCKPCKEQKRDYNGVRCRACQYGDEIDDIDSFHTAEQPHWILCSEKLPEKYDVVFATYETRQGKERFMRLTEWTGDRWISHDDEYKISRDKEEYVAWMPLPEPYKEGEK